MIVVLSIALVASACMDEPPEEIDSAQEPFVYVQYEWDDLPAKQFLGSPEAEHTLLLAFDYACSWCKLWMTELLPDIEETLIDTGQLKYYSQAVVLLSQESLRLAQADHAIETLYPEHYFDVQRRFAADSGTEGWGGEAYIADRLQEVGLAPSILEDKRLKDDPDRLRLTRDYTRNRNLQSVPSVYVDGIQVSDPFDLEEIIGIIARE